MMKHILFFTFVLLAVMLLHDYAFAQPSQTEPAAQGVEETPKDETEKKIEMFGKMKISGIVLTSSGIVLLVPGLTLTILGAIMVAVNFVMLRWGVMTGWAAVYAAGVIMTGIGGVSLLSGIPLWVVGAVKEKKYKKKRAGFLPVFGYDPTTETATLGVRFAF